MTGDFPGPRLSFLGQLDVSEAQAVYLCAFDDGRFLRLSKTANDLYRAVQEGASFTDIATAQQARGRQVSEVEIAAAYHLVLEKVSLAAARGKMKPSGFWLQFNIIPAALVARVSRILSLAYHPASVVFFLSLIVSGVWYAIGPMGIKLEFTPRLFWPGYALFLGSLLAHEFGHAAACARYGASPGPVGATMYLFFPAFYSDVTSAWPLKRWQRVVVGIGGTYFQLVVGAAFSLAYLVSGWVPLQIAIVLIAGACLFSLNPVLKFDGYWVVADALGVSNLSQLPSILFRQLRGMAQRRPQPPLPWPTPILWVLVMYSLANIAFWGWFIYVVTGKVVLLVDNLPSQAVAAFQPLVFGGFPESGVLIDLLTSLFMLIFIGVIGFRIVVRLTISLSRFFSRRVQAVWRTIV